METNLLETERLYLREMNQSDYKALSLILQDEETMQAYNGAFTDTKTQDWLDRQIKRYEDYTNIPSQNVALRSGMTITETWTKHYRGIDMPHYLFTAERASI